MARYVISDHLNVAARGEWARSHTDMGAPTRTSWRARSCSASTSARTSSFGPEFRIDHNGQSMPFSNTGTSNQITGTLAALTYF